jgi:uncharacterized protein (DUF983 family)
VFLTCNEIDERDDLNVPQHPASRCISSAGRKSVELREIAVTNTIMNKPPAEDPEFERWPPPLAVPQAERIMPSWPVTIWRGLCGRCPQCGAAPIFDGYLKVHETCLHCAAPLGDMPADDAPPYVAMLAVLHFVALFVVLFFKGYYRPSILMAGILLLVLAAACMIALRLAKGAIIGILLKLGLKREVPNG